MQLTIGSVLLGLALVLVVMLVLSRPFLVHPDQLVRPAKKQKALHRLISEKDAVLDEIRDLDFDHDTGKIPTEVYEPQRAHMMAHAAELLKTIDARKQRRKKPRPSVTQDIETAVAQLRRSSAPAAAAPAPKAKANGSHKFCSECGQPVDPTDKFCTACGQPLRTTQPA